MNRCIRDPYVQWCERCTPLVTTGGAAYSISCFYSSIVTILKLLNCVSILYAFDSTVLIVSNNHLNFFSAVVIEYNLLDLLAFVIQY